MSNSTAYKTCAMCAAVLTDENRTGEHIIPNCIGGRRKTSGFICKRCNSDFGRKWEAVLAEQFLWFSHATGIKRERGKSPNLPIMTVSGDELLLRHDGTIVPAKPAYVEQDEDGKVKIQIKARTKEEARHILKGAAQKFPSVDVQAATDNLVVEQAYLVSPLAMSLQFGGPDAGRSMVKTALALASEYGIDHSKCGKAINYLKNEEALPPFGFCYTVDLVKNRPQTGIFHCVAVRGLPNSGKLLAYVEYFNTARILIELSDEYDGEDFCRSYAIDPTDATELDIQIRFDVDIRNLLEIIDGEGMPLDKYEEAVNHSLSIILQKNFDRERTRAVTEATKLAFEELGVAPNEMLPPERIHEFSAIVVKRLAPFLRAHMNGRFELESIETEAAEAPSQCIDPFRRRTDLDD